MRYRLWGEPNSGSFMIESALAETCQEVELIDIDLAADQQHNSNYMLINPAGKIPALQLPDGSLMTQSAAILIALDEAYPDAGLLPHPGDPKRRDALRWLIFIVAEVYPLIEISDYPGRFAPPEVAGEVRALVRDRMRERWDQVEAVAAGSGTFLPGRFSAVDLAIAIVSSWQIGKDWRASKCPKLHAIASAVSRRPKVSPVWLRHRLGA